MTYPRALSAVAAVLLSIAPVAAQDHGPSVQGYLGVGPGSHLISRSSATATVGGIAVRVGRRVATVQAVHQSYSNAPRNVWGVGFLVGRVIEIGPAVGWFALGLGAVGGEYEKCEGGGFIISVAPTCTIESLWPSLAVPLETRLILWPRRFVGVDLVAYVNINLHRPFTGVAAALRIGRVKPRRQP